MRLCIPIPVRSEGGLYTFIGTLTAWLDKQGIAYTDDPDADYDVLFANSWAVDYSLIRRTKRSHPSIVVAHRVDGSAADYGGNPDADRKQARVNLLADVTIFQSEYSRHSTREKFPVVSQDGPVIHNPVDIERFRPGGDRIDLPAGTKVACVSWSTNRRKGNWQIEEIAAANPAAMFVLCGRFEGISDRPNIVRLGYLDRDALAAALRSCDVFLSLTENDAMPNVVLEALASGLPVLYRASGGVPEVVGDCGVAMEPANFAAALRQIESRRAELSAAARQRAETHFAPDVILPRYMAAMSAAARRPEPSTLQVMKLLRGGYPVLPKLEVRRTLSHELARRAPNLRRRQPSMKTATVGWITYDSFPRRKTRFAELDSFTVMRAGNVAQWINHHHPGIHNELYAPDRRYDVVVFQKMMDARCQSEADRIQRHGGKVIFDANVNYYDIEGDYFIPGTQPTPQQQQDAVRMTTLADWVVADSTYLAEVIARLNPRVTWIADNVNLEIYKGLRRHSAAAPLRLIWSGIGKKAAHLLEAKDAFAAVPGLELVIVTDEPPSCLAELERALPCRVVKFSDRAYARALMNADVIVSPKRIANAYERGHTEYKIALGMAVGLPAIASPQQSYIEAIGAHGGGIIATTTADWIDGLRRLQADPALRARMGAMARRTVRERYATPVIAKQYLQLLEQLAGGGA